MYIFQDFIEYKVIILESVVHSLVLIRSIGFYMYVYIRLIIYRSMPPIGHQWELVYYKFYSDSFKIGALPPYIYPNRKIWGQIYNNRPQFRLWQRILKFIMETFVPILMCWIWNFIQLWNFYNFLHYFDVHSRLGGTQSPKITLKSPLKT